MRKLQQKECEWAPVRWVGARAGHPRNQGRQGFGKGETKTSCNSLKCPGPIFLPGLLRDQLNRKAMWEPEEVWSSYNQGVLTSRAGLWKMSVLRDNKPDGSQEQNPTGLKHISGATPFSEPAVCLCHGTSPRSPRSCGQSRQLLLSQPQGAGSIKTSR